jgi:hypothetical protein
VVFGCLFLEILTRTLLGASPISAPSGVFEYDPEKVFALKKNLRGGVFAGKPVNTNSVGLRDDEISWQRERSEIRILLLGDSISFGHGVLAEQTFSYHLERLLE